MEIFKKTGEEQNDFKHETTDSTEKVKDNCKEEKQIKSQNTWEPLESPAVDLLSTLEPRGRRRVRTGI